MEIIPVTPRGYCQGVIHAIQIAKKTCENYPDQKISMLGMIVHNKYVVEACQAMGINCLEAKNKTRLELLDEIDEGVVILTAHGVSNKVKEKAIAKGLILVDATCKDVTKTHETVLNHLLAGDVIYIGKKNHPEAEGVKGLDNRIHLVTCLEDINALPTTLNNVLITNQTTLSILDIQDLISACIAKYPTALVEKEICNATSIRQQAVMNLKDIDTLIVVGDPHSNNTNQLQQIGIAQGIKHTYLVENVTQLKKEMFEHANRVAITSGSSTPTFLTQQVISFLQEYAKTNEFKLPELAKVVL